MLASVFMTSNCVCGSRLARDEAGARKIWQGGQVVFRGSCRGRARAGVLVLLVMRF